MNLSPEAEHSFRKIKGRSTLWGGRLAFKFAAFYRFFARYKGILLQNGLACRVIRRYNNAC